MIFSKSFGYAVRGVLYIALMRNEKPYIQAEEIAAQLAVPRHFMGKILKNLVKSGVLASVKGPSGGFAINPRTLDIRLIEVLQETEGLQVIEGCSLGLKECSSRNPCPLHHEMQVVKERIRKILGETTFGELLHPDKQDFIKSITTATPQVA